METLNRILDHAEEMFLRIGVKSITLNDLARELGISKKTIYQHFENKAQLVQAVSERFFRSEEAEMLKITANAKNAIEEIVLIMQGMVQSKANISQNLIFEVQKYYPKAWRVFEGHSCNFMMQKVEENLRRGVAEGLYRSDLNIDLTARLRVAHVEAGFRPDLFPPNQFSFIEIQTATTEIYLHGIVSEKGREILQLLSQPTHNAQVFIPGQNKH